jgi:hypothetical protein
MEISETKIKRQLVSVVHKAGETFLVEYVQKGKICRSYVPVSDVDDDCMVSVETLAIATPYGFPWREIVLEFNPTEFEQVLQKAGIWTVDDLRQKPQVALGVIASATNLNYGALLRAAKIFMEVKK